MNELSSIKDKWILITGASKGLGREMAVLFGEAGANLIVTARSSELLEELRSDVVASGVECVTVAGDLRDAAMLEKVKSLCINKQIDVLVNNAGVVDITPLEGVSDERIDEVIELNLLIPIKLTKAVIGMFKDRKRGVIVNVNSAGGKKPVPDHTIYCASKYGFNGFAETLKLEIKGLGIRIITVCPGKMATELFNAAGRTMDTDAFISPREVAQGVLYMLEMSPKCSHAALDVDRMS
ncbi:MAG: SDR family oxidoreductase [Kiritimatiellia bacterium]|jgi:3-oxoacyl-[acyl-carrier protein] reductase|nr:SDR family oxidoreductase [Kiritimatiellia bacterium]